MSNKQETDEILKNLQETLKDNFEKAKEFAESNTKRNSKGEVLWDDKE